MRGTAPISARGRHLPSALAVVLLAIAGSGCAATPHYSPPTHTYYVGPAGDDAAAGTSPGDAWRTLARAERVGLQPGDRLLLAGGTRFSGTIALGPGEAGRAERPVVIGSYGDGRATIDATGAPAISVHNTAGVEIHGLTLTGRGGAYAGESGISLYNDREEKGKLRHIRVAEVDVSGFRVGISVGGTSDGRGFEDVSVRRSQVHGNKDAGLLAYGPPLDTGRPTPVYTHQDIAVERVRAHDNPGDPTANDRHTGNGITLGGVQRATVRDSTAHDNGTRAAADAPGGPVGIWAYDSTGVTLEHNTSYRNHTGSDADGGGFGLDSNVSASTVQYNLSFHNDGPGYYAYNRTVNGAHRDNTIRYNISSADGRKLPYKGGLSVHGKEVRDLRIYQNTVVMPQSPNGTAPAVRLWGGEKGVSLRNNLLVTDGAPLVNAESGFTPRDVVLQGNNYRSTDGQESIRWGGTTYRSLDTWRAATGQEEAGGRPTGLTADPCLAGGELPDIDRVGSAPMVVPECASLDARGLDLRAGFGFAPGSVDYFGRQAGNPPPIGAAVPRTAD